MKIIKKFSLYLLGFLISISAVAALMFLLILGHLKWVPAASEPLNIGDLLTSYGTVATVVIALTIAIVSWLREHSSSKSREIQKSEYVLLIMDEPLQQFHFNCEVLSVYVNNIIRRFKEDANLESYTCLLINNVWNFQRYASNLDAIDFSIVEKDLNVLEGTDFEISRAIVKCIQNKSIIARELQFVIGLSPSYGIIGRRQIEELERLANSVKKARHVNDYLRPKYLKLNQ